MFRTSALQPLLRRTTLPARAALLALLLLVFSTPALRAADTMPPVGTAVAIGGALSDDNSAVWGRLVQLAGGPGARFVVLATASADPQRTAAQIVVTLQRHGALAEAMPVAPGWPGVDVQQAVQNPRLTQLVGRAQGVFFSGGAQARLLDTLQPGGHTTPLLAAIHALFGRGGVVAGTSSGAAVLSDVVFRDAPDVLAVLKGRLRDGVEVDRGFAFVRPGLAIDQHFIQRGRIGRLLPLMVAKGLRLGVGVEEDSAVIVRGEQVEVIGARGALVVDLYGAGNDATLGAFNIHNARLSWLESGDRFDLASRSLQASPAQRSRQRLDVNAPGFKGEYSGAVVYNDMLGDGTLVAAMARLVDSDQRELFGLAFAARPLADDPQPALGFEWRLHKGADTLGWARADGSVGTLAGVLLDVRPVRMAQPLFAPWLHPGRAEPP